MAARTVVASGRLALGGGPLAAASRPRLRAPRQRGRVEWGERVDRPSGHSTVRVASSRPLKLSHPPYVRHTRHARGRSARRPPPSLAADHAAALWQLWCRVGRTTTITCQVVESHALYHRLQRATGAGRGANAGTAQRAGDGGRTYPANQHRVCIHTLSCVRRLTMLVPIGTAFGYGTRTHTLSRTLRSPSIGRAEARATDATRGDSRALLDESTARAGRVGPLAEVEWTGARGEWTSREWRVGEFQGATRRYTGSTRPVEWPHGESTRRGAAVHSVRRGARGGGRLAGASRPPPVPVPPPLPLRALPIAVYLVGAWSGIGQVSACMPGAFMCSVFNTCGCIDVSRY